MRITKIIICICLKNNTNESLVYCLFAQVYFKNYYNEQETCMFH